MHTLGRIQLRILPLEAIPQQHRRTQTGQAEARVRNHSSEISWPVLLQIEVWRVYLRKVANSIDQRNGSSTLLQRLGQSGRDPGECDVVAPIHASERKEHGEVSCWQCHRRGGDDIAGHGDEDGENDVVGALAELVRCE